VRPSATGGKTTEAAPRGFLWGRLFFGEKTGPKEISSKEKTGPKEISSKEKTGPKLLQLVIFFPE